MKLVVWDAYDLVIQCDCGGTNIYPLSYCIICSRDYPVALVLARNAASALARL